MAKIEPRTLRGFRDYLPEQMLGRKWMIDRIASVFERYGFWPMETPALEYSEILLGKYGADAEHLFYRFTDAGDRDVCLRYDLTVPLARVVAQYGNLPRPFRRYQIAPVWRAEKPAKGRFREFFQCDADIVGTPSLLADAECVAVGNDVLTELGITNFRININNRKVLTGLFEALALGDAEGEAGRAILRAIDKLAAMGEETVRALLADDCGLEAATIDRLFDFLAAHGDNDELLANAERIVGGSQTGAAGLAELRELLTYTGQLGVPAERVRLDFAIARGLDYYTGSVFETFLLDLPALGSVMSGGRYDTLISTFLGRDMPAVGISTGIDRLFAGVTELGELKAPQTATTVLLAPMGADQRPQALKLTGELRAAGIPTEVYLEEAKLGKQLKYANQRGIALVVILGPDEIAAGQAAVKMMSTGEQVNLPLGEVAAKALALLPK